jgi:urea carboxylase
MRRLSLSSCAAAISASVSRPREARMIYAEPKISPGGDRMVLMELGDEMSFELNFLVHGLARLIREAGPDGVVELIPELASVLVSYDPDRISYGDLVRELRRLRASIGATGDLELESRLYYVPILYFDRWTRACHDDYCARMKPKTWDGDLVVEANGFTGLDQLKRQHSATEYWVAALGFYPGLCSLLPLDPRCRLTAPKYDPPRTWTPKGTIGLGGALTCIYPDETPGGYQIFARTPMPIWDPAQRLAAFKDSLALFRPGDRVRFVPIDESEFLYIEGKVADGTYKHQFVDFQKFSIAGYCKWLADIDPAERF